MNLLLKASVLGTLLSTSLASSAFDSKVPLTVQVDNKSPADRPRRTIIVQSFSDQTCAKQKKLHYVPMKRGSDSQKLKPISVPSDTDMVLDFTLFEFALDLHQYCSVIGAVKLNAGTGYVANLTVDRNVSSCTLTLHEQESGAPVEFTPLTDVCTISGNKSGVGRAVKPQALRIRMQTIP